MKNEKYIAPEMEVVDVKMDASLLSVSCTGYGIDQPHCDGGHFAVDNINIPVA